MIDSYEHSTQATSDHKEINKCFKAIFEITNANTIFCPLPSGSMDAAHRKQVKEHGCNV